MTFRIGQRVVCVAAPWMHVVPTPWVCPDLNSVYVVREILPRPNGRGASCRLIEIRNEPIYGREPAFCTSFFRPVVERKTDISVFTALLNTEQRENVLCGNE